MPRVTELTVNGKRRPIDADSQRTLLSVLRDDVSLTGCKYGCGETQCGACTVLLDGKPARSCTTPVSAGEGKEITTVESFEQDGKLHPLQHAFLKHDAMQCGYCTAGMIVEGVAFLKKNPDPTDDEIIRGMNGHICRCGTYHRVVAAIKDAAKTMKEAQA